MLRLGHALHSCRLAQPCVWNTLQVLDEGVWAVDFSSQIRRAHSDERPQRRGGRRGGERRSPGKRGSSEQERPMESALFDLLTSSSTKKPSKELDSLLKENASLFIDTSKLPLLKYTMSEKEFNRFVQGKSTTEERKKVLKIYETVLPRRREQVAMMADYKQKMEDVSVRRDMAPRYVQTEEEILASIRERVCQFYSIEESEYEKHKTVALENIRSGRTSEKIEWKEEEELMKRDPLLEGKALSLKTNPSMSDAARKQIAKVLLDYS